MHSRQRVVAWAVVAGAIVCSIGCSTAPDPSAASRRATPTPAAAASPVPASTISDARMIAADLPLLPEGVNTAVRPPETVRAVYEFAARHPEVLRYVPCFCGCERGGHKDNADCFVSSRDATGKVTAWESHGMVCDICMDIAFQARQMHNSGASTATIRDAIEKKYAALSSERHTHTPTPPAPRGRSGG